uniref:Uncharacterized protein n=1 Tax=Meloidogyne enterolobii TaxID=390850 RepID=A0A6V7W919_MELEN|nr:unnamed protein product [Meloidogyne enterolobii]
MKGGRINAKGILIIIEIRSCSTSVLTTRQHPLQYQQLFDTHQFKSGCASEVIRNANINSPST